MFRYVEECISMEDKLVKLQDQLEERWDRYIFGKVQWYGALRLYRYKENYERVRKYFPESQVTSISHQDF